MKIRSHTENQTDKQDPVGSAPVPTLLSLANRTILVIGGARGLGAGGVLGCLEAGASVSILDILSTPCEPEWSIAKEVAGRNGADLSYGVVDVTDKDVLTRAIAEVFASAAPNAPVTGLFVTAGINAPFPATEVTMDIWDRIYAINVRGSMLCSQIFANEWIKRHPGHPPHRDTASIILTASLVAHNYNRLSPSATYASTKGAVKQMARALGAEWGVHGIRVNASHISHPKMTLTGAEHLTWIRTTQFDFARYTLTFQVQTVMTADNDTRRPGYTKGMAEMTAIKRVSTPDEFKGQHNVVPHNDQTS